MLSEILTKIPTSGQYKEINFGQTNHLLWVKFTDDDYSEWVGKFDHGISGVDLLILENTSKLIVVSGGLLYRVDIPSKRILFTLKNDAIREALFDPDLEKIIIHDDLAIEIYSHAGQKEDSTGRVSCDGIEFEKLEDGIIYGRVNDLGDWVTFTFDIENKSFVSDFTFKSFA